VLIDSTFKASIDIGSATDDDLYDTESFWILLLLILEVVKEVFGKTNDVVVNV